MAQEDEHLVQNVNTYIVCLKYIYIVCLKYINIKYINKI